MAFFTVSTNPVRYGCMANSILSSETRDCTTILDVQFYNFLFLFLR